MSQFLLIIVVMLSNGQKRISVEKFSNHAECHKAMQIVSEIEPDSTVYCRSLGMGDDE